VSNCFVIIAKHGRGGKQRKTSAITFLRGKIYYAIETAVRRILMI